MKYYMNYEFMLPIILAIVALVLLILYLNTSGVLRFMWLALLIIACIGIIITGSRATPIS